jgi:hypothetical protein
MDTWEILGNRRRLAEECLEISRRTLAQLGQELGDGKLAEPRLEVLLAGIVRALNSSNAIGQLFKDLPYFEEMNILLRSLVELVINCLYLQVSSPEDLESYLQYDSIMLAKAIRFGNEFHDDVSSQNSQDLLSAFDEHVNHVEKSIGGTISRASWTKLDLHSRAVAVDNILGANTVSFLSRVVYQAGHAFTHGNYSSLYETIETLKTGAPSQTRMTEEANHALFGTAQTLHIFAKATNSLKAKNVYADLSIASELLQQ